MRQLWPLAFLSIVCCMATCFAQTATAQPGEIFDRQFKNLESELVPLAEAMPADKYSFAPSHGEFRGVRTFGQQVSHTAAVIYAVCSSVLGEKNPTDMGPKENGPASLQSKEQILDYLKQAVAYGHKAMASITSQNLTEMVQSPFGSGKAPRMSMASIALWHSFDHYGQMVVYLRMNGIGAASQPVNGRSGTGVACTPVPEEQTTRPFRRPRSVRRWRLRA